MNVFMHPEINTNLKKKFYRDFDKFEKEAIEELTETLKSGYIHIPPHVIEIMAGRDIITREDVFSLNKSFLVVEKLHKLNSQPGYKNVETTVREGMPFEFSNEGVMNKNSPYRLVLTKQFGDQTLFVKVSVPPLNNRIKVLDVWQKKGEIPLHPYRPQIKFFERGREWEIDQIVWDLIDEYNDNADSVEGDKDTFVRAFN
jgi:hypothetical protein